MHDIVTGFWEPNEADGTAGFRLGFGATINVINGGLECGSWSSHANHRVDYYRGLMGYFGVEIGADEQLGCSDQTNRFAAEGTGAQQMQSFDRDWSQPNSCKLVSWSTAYSVFTPGDYKRCVCSFQTTPCDL
jgi:hypothetical protein